MTDLEKYTDVDSWAQMLGPVGDLAAKISGTELVGKGFRGKPASVAAAIFAGRELGLGPLTSLRGLQVIDGSVSMTAQMMSGKILAAGHQITWIETTDTAAEVRIVRGDGLGEATARFTLKDAQRAGLANKTNWQRWPRRMLQARALSEAASLIAADVILGLEAADAPEGQERPVQASAVVQVRSPQAGTPLRAAPEPPLAAPGMFTHPQGHLDPRQPLQTPAKQDAGAAGEAKADATATSPAAPSPRTQEPEATEPNDIIDAEVVEDEPTPDPVTPAQLRKIGALIGQLEKHDGHRMDRDERRSFIAAVLQIDHLESAKDLTKAQAHDVIEGLQRILAEVPQTAYPINKEYGQ